MTINMDNKMSTPSLSDEETKETLKGESLIGKYYRTIADRCKILYIQ